MVLSLLLFVLHVLLVTSSWSSSHVDVGLLSRVTLNLGVLCDWIILTLFFPASLGTYNYFVTTNIFSLKIVVLDSIVRFFLLLCFV